MKRRTVGVLTLLMIFLGSCVTLAIATPITDLGTVEYFNNQDNFIVSSDIIGDAYLTFAYSEVNESGLLIERMWYDSTTDKTTYKFTTQKLSVDWWFISDVKEYIYLDESNDKLYKVSVNYAQIDIPENPYENNYQKLMENYTAILNNYTSLLNDYNLSNETLADLILQFNEINELYNLTEQNYMAALANFTNLTALFNQLDADYNATHALWISAVGNVTHFQGEYDSVAFDYDQLEEDHNSLAGTWPWYVFAAVLGTFLATFVYLRRKTVFETRPEQTDEITTGYGKKHSSIDKYILSRFKKEPAAISQAVQEVEQPVDQPSVESDIMTAVHEKIDVNNRATNTKIESLSKEIAGTLSMLADLSKKIDKISSTGTSG